MATPETQEVRAQAKWVRTSPRKARLVAEHIRGRSVPEARAVLAFTPKAAARDFEKVLRSAVANAEANHGLLGDELVVSAAYVDEGPTLKRWRARARGRVARIRKRTCHITVLLVPAPESATTRGGRRRGQAAAEEPKPRARRPAVRRRKSEEPAAAVETVEATEAAVEPETPESEPEAEATASPEVPAERAPGPEAEAGAEGVEAAEEPAPKAEEKPKTRRRPSVRRKKTDETEKES